MIFLLLLLLLSMAISQRVREENEEEEKEYKTSWPLFKKKRTNKTRKHHQRSLTENSGKG